MYGFEFNMQSGWRQPIEYAVIVALGLVLLYSLKRVLGNSIVYIPVTEYGVVERKWSLRDREEPFGLIAVNGGAGFLPHVIRAGWHMFMPFQYRVHKRKLITIDQIGYLVARVGAPLGEGQALGEWPLNATIENALGFLDSGGQRGTQRRIIRSGTYAINTALFCVITENEIYSMNVNNQDDLQLKDLLNDRKSFDPILIADDNIGIVTVQDGPALQHGEIIAPTVGTDPNNPETFHNSFQDISIFLRAGGRRGRQDQVLVDGTYYINRLFATVEIKPKTSIDIGMVGVVNSFVGPEVQQVLEAEGGRGRTVEPGKRGIWSKPFEPGKYAINPYAMTVTMVPTTNFQLRWIEGVTGSAGFPGGISYDDDLSEIPVITKDAFSIDLPLSIVAHIAPMNAPHVIQRFSKIERLVNQTLDPLVSSYFKDAAQQRTLLEFIQNRNQIGQEAREFIKDRLTKHKIEIEEVMLGTPRPSSGDTRMQALLEQLRLRQIAKEEQETYANQMEAAKKKRALNEEQARADQQAGVTQSALAIQIAENEGQAETARKSKAAEGIKIMADAEAYAVKARVEAVGGTEAFLKQMALEAVTEVVNQTRVPLVPSVLVKTTDGENGGMDGITGMLLGIAMRSNTSEIPSLMSTMSEDERIARAAQ